MPYSIKKAAHQLHEHFKQILIKDLDEQTVSTIQKIFLPEEVEEIDELLADISDQSEDNEKVAQLEGLIGD